MPPAKFRTPQRRRFSPCSGQVSPSVYQIRDLTKAGLADNLVALRWLDVVLPHVIWHVEELGIEQATARTDIRPCDEWHLLYAGMEATLDVRPEYPRVTVDGDAGDLGLDVAIDPDRVYFFDNETEAAI